MRIITILLTILLLCSIANAALTTVEKNFLKEIYVYYSGQIASVPQNDTIQTTILEGSESERKAVIKAHLENIVIPNLQSNYAIVQAEETRLSNLITQLQAWVAAN